MDTGLAAAPPPYEICTVICPRLLSSCCQACQRASGQPERPAVKVVGSGADAGVAVCRTPAIARRKALRPHNRPHLSVHVQEPMSRCARTVWSGAGHCTCPPHTQRGHATDALDARVSLSQAGHPPPCTVSPRTYETLFVGRLVPAGLATRLQYTSRPRGSVHGLPNGKLETTCKYRNPLVSDTQKPLGSSTEEDRRRAAPE